MSPREYLQAIKDRLAAEGAVSGYEIVREQVTASNAQLRMRITLTDGSRMEFAEYVRLDDNGELEVPTYSYHWMDTDNRLRVRWDNAEHYPRLPGFPHHIHEGDEKRVIPGEPMTLFRALDHIIAELNR